METTLKLALTGLFLSGSLATAQVANTPEFAARIVEMGPELSREMVGGTMKMYSPIHAAASDDGLSITRDAVYGVHERHRLDVFAPEGAENLPVLVFVHGGGFVRGDKKGISNIGRWFAQHGVVAVTINYRFAPDAQWPSGAQDLGAALGWMQGNIAELGGDPSKIIVAGNSAGAMHVADYVFREDLQIANDGVVGAILLSTPTVDLTNRKVDPKRDALYYGTASDRSEQSVVNYVDGRKIPVLVGYAEYEPVVISDQVRRLIDALTQRDGQLPLITSAAGHNHISLVSHIGSADESLAPDMIEFILQNTMHGQ